MKVIVFGSICSSASCGMEYKTSLWQVVCCDLPLRFQPQYLLVKTVIAHCIRAQKLATMQSTLFSSAFLEQLIFFSSSIESL